MKIDGITLGPVMLGILVGVAWAMYRHKKGA